MKCQIDKSEIFSNEWWRKSVCKCENCKEAMTEFTTALSQIHSRIEKFKKHFNYTPNVKIHGR